MFYILRTVKYYVRAVRHCHYILIEVYKACALILFMQKSMGLEHSLLTVGKCQNFCFLLSISLSDYLLLESPISFYHFMYKKKKLTVTPVENCSIESCCFHNSCDQIRSATYLCCSQKLLGLKCWLHEFIEYLECSM